MSRPVIPAPVVATVSAVLQESYSHAGLDALFMVSGVDLVLPPGTTKLQKCMQRMKWANDNEWAVAQPLAFLGGLIAELMDEKLAMGGSALGVHMAPGWKKIHSVLERQGLAYQAGGHIVVGAGVASPATKTLGKTLRSRDMAGIELEFKRALENVESDPGSSITAACAILEAFFKTYIEDNKLQWPTKRDIHPLWRVVQKDLGLDPASQTNDDLIRILGGLASVVDGIGAVRTHAGSAHGQGRTSYKAKPRHARLAVHAAHTLLLFMMETWDERAVAVP